MQSKVKGMWITMNENETSMPEQNPSLEELLTDVENIISRLQQKDISLEDSFALYQQGIGKLKLCNEKIDAVEKKLLILDEEGQLQPDAR